MKRNFSKFLGVGLALVLVVSFSLIPAVPAAASHTSSSTIDFASGASTVTGTTGVILDVTVTNSGASAGDINEVKIDFTASDFTVTGTGATVSGWTPSGPTADVVTYTATTGIAPGASVIFSPAVTNPAVAGPAAVPAVTTTDAGSKAALAAASNTGWIGFLADAAGAGGNDITVVYVDPGLVSFTLSASLAVKAITVNLGTDAGGAVKSTAAEVATEINTVTSGLVDATADSGHLTYVVQPLTVPAFTGGTSPDADNVSPVTPATLTITGVVPVVSTVSPVKGNVGDTMWVEVTGTEFTGTALTNASTTSLNFGTGITVAATKFISATEIDAQITITASGALREVIATTAAGTGTVGSGFTPNAADTAQVDVWLQYTPDTDTIFDADTLEPRATTMSYASITAGVGAATSADVLIAHAGTYTEDLVIPAGKDNLELAGATGATIKGVSTFPGPFPGGIDNIDILASGVKIHGFTIESPNAASGEYASGMLIGASNVEIYDNAFKTHTQATGQYSVVIQTYRKVLPGFETVDLSGLNIHNNTFDDLGDGAVGYDGIFVNIDTGTGTATIADNVFTGSLFRAISAERPNMVISGNSIITDLPPWTSGFAGGYQGMFIGCFAVDTVYPPQSDVSVTGNTVKGATSSEGFVQGIRIGHTSQTSLTNITVSRNTVQDCDEGITVRADATGVTVNYNDITGNTVGVQNDDTGVDLDAKYNWWGGKGGPGGEGMGLGTSDNVSADADYDPWLTVVQATAVSEGVAYHGSTYPLQAGWNTLSVPLALSDSADTLSDIAALGDFLVLSGTSRNYDGGFYYDGTLWQPIIASTYEFQPGAAVYIKMVAAADIPILFSGVFSLPSVSLPAGWNLVGSTFGIDKSGSPDGDYGIAGTSQTDGQKVVNVALASLGTDASVVISPSMPGQTAAWATVATDGTTKMIVGEGYWVFMTSSATLAGFQVTPIYWIAP